MSFGKIVIEFLCLIVFAVIIVEGSAIMTADAPDDPYYSAGPASSGLAVGDAIIGTGSNVVLLLVLIGAILMLGAGMAVMKKWH